MRAEYLRSFHKNDLIIILNCNDSSKHFSININFIELNEYKPELARELLNDPERSLEEWDKAAFSTQLSLLKEIDKKLELKNNIHCRIFYLAHLARRAKVFPGNKEEGQFLQISGTVMRMTVAKVLEYQRNYICVKCKYSNMVKADYRRKYIIKQPTKCKNPEGCEGTNLIRLGDLDTDNCKDYQEIKIQERQQGMSSTLSTMWVTLEDDLVDSCQPGDDVTICGIVKRRIGEFSPGKKIDVDIVFKANHIQVDTNSISFSTSNPESEYLFNNFWKKYDTNPLEGRDLILKSFCSYIYGLYPVKLAIACVLAGGSSIEDTTLTGVRTRSESHLLLVGDPGTAKSQLLRFASKIVPRAVLTTGVGSTSAGLTVAASMEHGEWQLEAGALVMSDGGICCIDEFNSMKEHDRTSLHEAMEQQTISVAKAKMVCKLNTRCSILAACNPKGNIDPSQSMPINIALPSPLLSRFDLVMILRDTVNQEWDSLVIDYILNGGNNFSKLTDFGLWPLKHLQMYFRKIKNFQPKLTEDAQLILITYYNIQRRMSTRNKARTTVRLLESLIRLSEGHARLMYHEKVLVIDSIFAIFLIDISMDFDSSVLNLNTQVISVFPERPKATYKDLLETILSKLQLFDILEKELNMLDANKEHKIQSRFFVKQNIKNVVEDDNTTVITEADKKNRHNSNDSINVTKSNKNANSTISTNTNQDNKIQKNNLLNNPNADDCSKRLPNDIFQEAKDIKPLNKLEDILGETKSEPVTSSSIITNQTVESEGNEKTIKRKHSSMWESGFDESILEDDNKLTSQKSIFNSFKTNDIINKQKKPRKVSSTRKKPCDNIQTDLEMLKFLPSHNLDIDLDFDWDNVGPTTSQSARLPSNNKSQMLENVDDIDFNL
ncbi:DNA helicase MCM9-like [Diorhabda carinulata]|uniref:DNA helicase MCM9-like n=1 Tax=Diorhabda carinulata TaxID=1163345 RepID=UPI0025A0346F|nr:DNA helicase MCM9-like [Diorhabda carinulata]